MVGGGFPLPPLDIAFGFSNEHITNQTPQHHKRKYNAPQNAHNLPRKPQKRINDIFIIHENKMPYSANNKATHKKGCTKQPNSQS